MEADPGEVLRRGAMSAFQVAAVGICVVMTMLDGFDVLAIAFTGPRIAQEWALSPTQLGYLFSAGLAGMTVGSLVLSPIADRLGRRPITLLCLAVMAAGMTLSAFAHGLDELAPLRAATGFGIGGLLASGNTLVVEYASAKRKDFAVSLMAIGYPLGATLGGILSVYLIGEFGWRSVFVFGGIATAALIPAVVICLPESMDFLLTRRPRGALVRINALLNRMNREAIAELPAQARAAGAASPFAGFARPALLICTSYFMVMLPLYFLLNWTPKVLVDQGLSLATGISGTVLINVGGIAGGLALGTLAGWIPLRLLAATFMVLMFLAVAAFGFTGSNLPLLMGLALVIGFFMIGSIAALYALVAAAFPAGTRNTGTGLALGIGRIGAIGGPYLGGVLIAAHWSRPAYSIALALPLFISAFLVLRVPLYKAAAAEPSA